MKTNSLLLGLLALAAPVVAQQNLVIPAGMATSNPGTTTLGWRNTQFRFQMIYDTSHFLSQGINYPIVISRLQYRAGGGATSAGGETYTGVTVQMSSSPLDWNSASTTFANNLGTDLATVFNGTVTCLPAAGSAPNTYIIDIPLATPFTYDPTSGLDLLIDVDAPTTPIPTGIPTMAASSNASHLARRVSTTTVGSPTGALSYFACVVLMDFNPAPNAATATAYGAGCVDQSVSYYEDFQPGTFDLAGSPGTPNSIMMTPLNGGYIVTPGPSAWFNPTSTALTLADDELTTPLTMPFTFAYPGGSTTDILVCSNGFVYLDTTQTSTSAAGSVPGLLTFGARLAPLWNDLDPSVGGAVHFDVDPSNTAVYVTWDQVPLFGNGAAINTLQLAIFADGRVEYRYQAIQNALGLTGFSPGNGARDGGAVDISTAMPFLTQPDLPPLSLAPINRPKIGSTFNLEVRDFPAGASIGAVSLGFTQFSPGLDLTPLGARGCFQHASFDGTFSFAVAGATQAFPLNIPNDLSLAGLHVYGQAVSTGPSSNALGIVTSNGVDLLLDRN
jgi:hypothetical protein